MTRYWLYLNDEVLGPFEVDALIRQRGFSRQARVCVERPDGGTGAWMSPAEIPDLARIFRAADEWTAPETPGSRPAPKPAVPAPRRSPPAAPRIRPAPVEPPRRAVPSWIWFLAFIGMAVGAAWVIRQNRQTSQEEHRVVRELVENAAFPRGRPDATIRDYLARTGVKPRWSVERTSTGLYRVTLSWFDASSKTRSNVYAFEVNQHVLTVRPINSAAERWMSEPPAASKPPPAAPEAKKPDPAAAFRSALETRRQSVESGNFAAVWNAFSRRKQSEMIQAGMSESGFVQLQTLRHKVDSGLQQKVVKNHAESPDLRWVLLRETTPQHGEVLIKQKWVREDGQWVLDDEERRAAETPASVPASEAAPTPTPVSIPVKSLPGVSN